MTDPAVPQGDHATAAREPDPHGAVDLSAAGEAHRAADAPGPHYAARDVRPRPTADPSQLLDEPGLEQARVAVEVRESPRGDVVAR